MLPTLNDQENKQAIIKKHSALVTMQNMLRLDERKLVNPLLIYAITSLRKNPTQRLFTVGLNDLRKCAGIKNTDTNKLKKNLQVLRQTEIKFNFFDKSKDDRWDCFAFLGGVTIKRGILEYSFPHQIAETMLHPEMYAKINDSINGLFKSIYSLAIYEYAKDYINVSIPIMELDNFKEFLGIQNKYHKMYDFKKRVLDVAINEINDKTDIFISYKLIRTGLKFTHIRLFAKASESVLKVLPHSKPMESMLNVLPSVKTAETSSTTSIELDKYISMLPEKLRNMKKTRDLVNKYLIDQGVALVESNINYFNAHSVKKNFAYLKIVFEKDSGEESRAETLLKIDKRKKVIELTRKQEDETAKSNADFAVLVDRAEIYFQELSPKEQSKILTELPKLRIFVPVRYKKSRNFGAKILGYFQLKKVDFMD